MQVSNIVSIVEIMLVKDRNTYDLHNTREIDNDYVNEAVARNKKTSNEGRFTGTTSDPEVTEK